MVDKIPVIDMWAPVVPSHEIIEHMAGHFPEPQLGYIRVFFKQEPNKKQFEKFLYTLKSDDDVIIQSLDAAGITRVLITGFDEATTGGTTFVTNESVNAIAKRHPDRFIPFVGVDIMRGREGVKDVEYWIKEQQFCGLSLRPFMIGLPADDKNYYPFYEKCVELDIPVSIHASANWTTSRPSDLGHPRHFDQVACDFPELKLILSHAGYPWVLEACLLAWKHPNLYLELAAHRPKYFTTPGTGWEPLLRFGQTTIQDKILFGTGSFLIGRSPVELVNEFRDIPLKPEVMEKWLWKNAARLLQLQGFA